jgi:hypothetical protein
MELCLPRSTKTTVKKRLEFNTIGGNLVGMFMTNLHTLWKKNTKRIETQQQNNWRNSSVVRDTEDRPLKRLFV